MTGGHRSCVTGDFGTIRSNTSSRHWRGRRPEKDAPPVDLSLERRLEALTAVAPRMPDVTHRVTLAGGMASDA
jgi:hypothetical protein